ncbi:amino acid adenylation domain-containing protein [Streptomyces sp. LD120]|uniref:Amino acid adenylation domain-containing protein n=2 Tax=Streptomyces physcomitrii TaxID=2724184 RepID=A0ABX1HBD9_9ACTN|nr:amino acid adenylation domain-containing protein [Streptomyces physcomitrii]
MWYAQALDPLSPAQNTAEYLEIHGPVDPRLFTEALHRTTGEADALRMRIADTPEGPRQYPVGIEAPGRGFPLYADDLRHHPDPGAAALAWMERDLARPFELSTGPLFQHALLRVGDARWLWYRRVHHLVMDGFGHALLARRTAEVYTALAAGGDPGPSPFGRFADLVAEDLRYRSGEQCARDRAHWHRVLDGCRGAATPAGRGAPASRTLLRRTARLPAGTAAGIRELAAALRATWPDVLIAAQALYTARASGAADVVIGVPLTGRTGTSALRVPGMAANVVPLRLSVRPEGTFAELTRQVVLGIRAARPHQRYRSEDLRRELGLLGGGRALLGPLVDIMPFAYGLSFAGAPSTPHNLSAGPVEDLTVHVHADGSGLRVDHDANPARYGPDELAAHQTRLLALLERLVRSDPGAPLAACRITTGPELHLVTEEFNDTARKLPATTLIGAVEAQVLRTPHAPALTGAGATLSYAELDTAANQLARHLVAEGLGPGRLAALALPRSPRLVVALLAVLKAGGACLPLDPGHPPDRLAHLLKDCAPHCLLTDSDSSAALPETGTPRLLLDRIDVREQPRVPPARALTPRHPAYVLHTSGSTGRPEGVVVAHRAADNRLRWMQDAFPIGPGDRVLQKSPLGFDVCVGELLWPLRTGATLVLTGPEEHRDPAALARAIRELDVTVCHFVPSQLREFLAEPAARDCRGLRHVFSSGEALTRRCVRDVHRLLPGARLHHLYGPTEAADVTRHSCPPGAEGPVPLGRPVWNTRLYVLDAGLGPCPPGVAGELFLAGAQLADGYLARPALTATRFLADPYGPPGSRMYRTGDLARWRPKGDLDFLGRTDDQVTLHGVRLEPGEIEDCLRAHRSVAAACVVLREDRPGERRLTAYVTAREGAAPDPGALRAHTASALPAALVPSAFVVLDALPLGPSGKADRTALPAPATAAGQGGRAPRTPAEETLTRLFAETLGVPRVDPEADFFLLGGTSLLAARLMSRAREALGTDTPLGALFRAPTPAGLAAWITGGSGEQSATAHSTTEGEPPMTGPSGVS